jgi:flagellar basal-body rod modification protein FlgD
MSVTAVATVPKTTATTAATTPVVTAKKTLGSEDFMKLLAVQFQSQDPMKPMEDTAFIAQMAQFSSLSQTQTMTTEMAKLSANQALATANSYLGQNVTVSDGAGGTASGNVSGVQVGTDGPRIVVGDYTYSLSSVLSVQPPTKAAVTGA